MYRRIANEAIGIDCRMILPGPVMTVLKSPSPPNRTFFTPFT